MEAHLTTINYRCHVIWHYIDVITTTMRSQITSLPLFTQPFIQTQIKENIKDPRYWSLFGEFTGTGEFPAQMASNAENVSIWWRHHVYRILDTCMYHTCRHRGCCGAKPTAHATMTYSGRYHLKTAHCTPSSSNSSHTEKRRVVIMPTFRQWRWSWYYNNSPFLVGDTLAPKLITSLPARPGARQYTRTVLTIKLDT